jgi:diaminohydroxyphosphoribosylaminopyrimidine deaminase / 5-amino-6-(5-phosphoribosylamino)uracil reductase
MFMKRCLQLASNGRATCSPNPMVGAVIVHQGKIIGEGWHRKAGEPHAEPLAVKSVRNHDMLKESTMYVSLEPCSHYGKTPPCVDLIIKKQIPRVVIGSLDAFPLVSGRGVSKLRAAGVEVVLGVEEASCLELNRAFFTFHTKKRPYIILKWAQTADGFLDILRKPGDGKDSLKISTSFSQILTHKLRTECDAILVGTNTAILDNPSLTPRAWTGKNPVRAVIDRDMILPLSTVLLNNKEETLIFTDAKTKKQDKNSWVHLDFNKSIIEQVLDELYLLNLQTLLVEGGTLMHESFLKLGMWDEIRIETSNQYIQNGTSIPDLSGLDLCIKDSYVLDAGKNVRNIQIIRPKQTMQCPVPH